MFTMPERGFPSPKGSGSGVGSVDSGTETTVIGFSPFGRYGEMSKRGVGAGVVFACTR